MFFRCLNAIVKCPSTSHAEPFGTGKQILGDVLARYARASLLGNQWGDSNCSRKVIIVDKL